MNPNNNTPDNQQPPNLGQPSPEPPQPNPPVPDWQQHAVAEAQTAAQGQQPPQPVQPQPPQQPFPSANQPNTAPTAGAGGGTGIPPQMGANTPPPKNKKPLVIIAAIVVVLALITGTYFLFFSGGDSSVDDATRESQETADTAATDMSTLASVAFSEPTELSGYQKSEPGSGATFSTYFNAAETCEFSFGTVTAAQLPGGDTIEAIVDKQIKDLRGNGATVEGPTAGEALILKNTNDPSMAYKMPTLVFHFSKDNARATAHYSISVLTSGDRAVVNRICGNEDGSAITDNKLEPLESKAKELTVTPGE